MTSDKVLSHALLLLTLPLLLSVSVTTATQFNVVNRCPYTVWAAAYPGGGQQLNTGDSWPLTINRGTTSARIWARTGCSFDSSGHGGCQTGDCGGQLSCTGTGQTPATLAEYSLTDQDYYDISLLEGFNVPMEFRANNNGNCKDIRCSGDINGQCPGDLRMAGGCNNPHTDASSGYFHGFCPDAYCYLQDQKTNACPAGTNYDVVFCP
nr:thaumatin-like protein [Allium sativum]UPH74552.1 thaumatin-like protein [Allium sativum]